MMTGEGRGVVPGPFDPIDRELGRLIASRCPGEAGWLIGSTAALLSAERARGHVCLRLSEWAGQCLGGEGWDAGKLTLPSVEVWKRTLEQSPLVGDGSFPTPIVVEGTRCYLYRYWRAECNVATQLRARVRQGWPAPVQSKVRSLFRELFPTTDRNSIDWQAVAAASALAGRLTLVSGAPGTGKTTIVARLLLLLLLDDPDGRVALAAPTGKAAARLAESVGEQIASIGGNRELLSRVPREAMTIHRLLGARMHDGGFRHGGSRLLGADVVVVDEASMVDLLLMDALLAALSPDTHLVLLGDKDQLASVETGVVFGDLCAAATGTGDSDRRDRREERGIRTAAWRGRRTAEDARLPGYSPEFAEWYHELSGQSLPVLHTPPVFRDGFVELTVNHRFGADSGIAALARLIRDGDADGVLAVLGDPARPEVEHVVPPADPRRVVDLVGTELQDYLASSGPEQALARLAGLRILCAVRAGPWGVEGMNLRVEHRLGVAMVGEPWYQSKPVLVTTNDYRLGLFNGDIGVCWPHQGRMTVWFATGRDGEVRSVAPSLLPRHETAWAMTVHKSQGSEFDHVVLVLPPVDSPLLTRELLYTGVTRARRSVRVIAEETTVRAAVGKAHRRASGLTGRLR